MLLLHKERLLRSTDLLIFIIVVSSTRVNHTEQLTAVSCRNTLENETYTNGPTEQVSNSWLSRNNLILFSTTENNSKNGG